MKYIRVSKHNGNIGDFVDYGDEAQAQTNIVNSIDPTTGIEL